ncbi:MAG: PilN domain-containing protein [Myxococcota bacterium]
MIRINLVPQKRNRRQQAVQNELTLFGVGFIVLVALLAAIYGVGVVSAGNLEGSNKKLQDTISQQQVIIQRMEATRDARRDREERLRVIKKLKLSKTGPVRMLAELSDATPEKLQLTSLEESDQKVKLSGIAANNEVISQFLSNLERSLYFDDVFLNAIDQTDVSGRKLKSFSISARLVIFRNPNAEDEDGKPKETP